MKTKTNKYRKSTTTKYNLYLEHWKLQGKINMNDLAKKIGMSKWFSQYLFDTGVCTRAESYFGIWINANNISNNELISGFRQFVSERNKIAKEKRERKSAQLKMNTSIEKAMKPVIDYVAEAKRILSLDVDYRYEIVRIMEKRELV